jgi:hypothetical protein
MIRAVCLWPITVLFAWVGCTPAQPSRAIESATPMASGSPVFAASRHFEFHSGMWLSVHHFLYNIAGARSGQPAASETLADTVGFGARSAGERRAWNDAVAFYAADLARRDAVFDTLMMTIAQQLGAVEHMPSLRDAGLDTHLTTALEGAAPVYRAVWWRRHDAANRAWISSMLPLLASYGDTLASGLMRAYEAPWPKPLLRVDVVPYANWAGAYSTGEPPYVTMGSHDGGYQGARGLEMLFHEASHAIADSMVTALRELAAATGKPAPFGVLHPIIFFTAGELTRRVVADYTPFAESAGFWRDGHRMAVYFPVIQRHWVPHLNGRTRLRDAMRAIIGEL